MDENTFYKMIVSVWVDLHTSTVIKICKFKHPQKKLLFFILFMNYFNFWLGCDACKQTESQTDHPKIFSRNGSHNFTWLFKVIFNLYQGADYRYYII